MSGLTPQEARVMELRDLGMMPGQIARELGIAHTTASRIISMYDDDPRHDFAYRRKMAAASAVLLARLEGALS